MSNSNTTVSTAGTTYSNKTFYDRTLLEIAKTRLVHASYGQKRSIPRNSGKRVEFRRYELFTPDANALVLEEGVTPAGQSLAQSKIEAEVKQYGAYVEVSDLLDLTSYDPVLAESTELLGEQLGTVVEWVTRDAMCAGTNVQYANGKTNRLALEAGDKLTVTEIRKAVRSLKKAKARMFNATSDGKSRKPHFICICSPDATYDLQSDALWQDVSKYSDVEQIYSGEIGRLFGVVFVESTEAKVFSQSVLTTVAAHEAGSAVVTLSDMPESAALYLVAGSKIKIGSTEYTVSSADAADKTVTLSETVAGAIAGGTVVYSEDAGVLDSETGKGMDVHATLVFGADAYGIIDVDGEGCLQTIVKPVGSGGASDPLDQRATVGAKVAAYTAKILNNLWIVRVEHGVSL
ncbi:MAG: N4-gp56 family major capsid protein [Clostridiales bacterium]|nr:N4-gp56 family major capsid protein [Clostridiales bacterium]